MRSLSFRFLDFSLVRRCFPHLSFHSLCFRSFLPLLAGLNLFSCASSIHHGFFFSWLHFLLSFSFIVFFSLKISAIKDYWNRDLLHKIFRVSKRSSILFTGYWNFAINLWLISQRPGFVVAATRCGIFASFVKVVTVWSQVPKGGPIYLRGYGVIMLFFLLGDSWLLPVRLRWNVHCIQRWRCGGNLLGVVESIVFRFQNLASGFNETMSRAVSNQKRCSLISLINNGHSWNL